MIVGARIAKNEFQNKRTFGQVTKLPDKDVKIQYEGNLNKDIDSLVRSLEFNNDIDVELHHVVKQGVKRLRAIFYDNKGKHIDSKVDYLQKLGNENPPFLKEVQDHANLLTKWKK